MNNTANIALVIAIATIVTIVIHVVFHRYSKKMAKYLNIERTNFAFLKNSITFVLVLITIIIVFNLVPSLKAYGKALFAGAGILAAVVGLASQKALTNIFSGIFIIMFKPFRVGDTIEIDKEQGYIEDITLRHTIIRNYENRRIIIPNSQISEKTIINSSIEDEKIRNQINFLMPYDIDLKTAKDIIYNCTSNHRFTIDNRNKYELANEDLPIIIRIVDWKENYFVLRVYVWSENNDNALILKYDLYETIVNEFIKAGLNMPYPKQNISIDENK